MLGGLPKGSYRAGSGDPPGPAGPEPHAPGCVSYLIRGGLSRAHRVQIKVKLSLVRQIGSIYLLCFSWSTCVEYGTEESRGTGCA